MLQVVFQLLAAAVELVGVAVAVQIDHGDYAAVGAPCPAVVAAGGEGFARWVAAYAYVHTAAYAPACTGAAFYVAEGVGEGVA